jgi:(p)ppGpp synthase/HD superfamily hydrolase
MTPTRLTPRFGDALALALLLHRGQERKGSRVPYIGHLLGTAGIVLHFGGDEDQAIAGLLHDAPEDQGGKATLELIRREFGDRVAEIVEGCSDTLESPKPPWKERKEAYVGKLPGEQKHVLLVSAADKLDNARAIVSDLRAVRAAGEPTAKFWTRFNAGKKGTLWYYPALVRGYKKGLEGPLADELDAAVHEMKRLA